ncbi:MAG TPA: class I SAM-dependent methyltransferase [Caulobacteraceae bacterium]|nr:class I SAM-dependent methyltransferase [Caulobacteraceae bacterium]
MDIAQTTGKKGDKGVVMEGGMARWYARTTAKSIQDFETDARRIAGRLAPGAAVLEVAPGPGYLAIALAKRGFRLTGLDISRSFVAMAKDLADEAGVGVDFRHGDVQAAPFEADRFDAVVCRAAFKNFADPVQAVCEMHRVLKPGGQAVIIDLRKDVTNAEIDAAVEGMRLNPLDQLMTGIVFKTTLRSRAYTSEDFLRLAAATPFGEADIKTDGIGLEVWLRKAA